MGNIRIDAALAETAQALATSTTGRLDAELLLAHVLDKPRSYLFTWPEQLLDGTQAAELRQLVSRRQAGVPVAYLIGQREFWHLTLKVTEATLIPRPDTELLVELALNPELLSWQEPSATIQVADLGTGSGAIALALASERPHWDVVAIDKSPAALAVARENAANNRITNTRFAEGSWCSSLEQNTMSLIVSNPPYIADGDPHLKEGDVRFEPISALTSGIDGLEDIRQIAEQALPCLVPGGWLLLEHGYDQGAKVQTILAQAGYTQIRTEADLAGHDRVTAARRAAG